MISAMFTPRHLLPILTALAIYLVLASHQLHLPGLHHDEAQEAGLIAMQLNNGLPPTLFRNTSISLAGRSLPLMVQDYIGSAYVYPVWVSFGLAGVSVESLRAVNLVVGMLTLLTAYAAAKQLVSQRMGALTILLLAVHPSFIFWSRQGVIVTATILPLALASLALVTFAWRSGQRWPLYPAAFLMGLGVWGKLLFVWFMVGLVVAGGSLVILGFILGQRPSFFNTPIAWRKVIFLLVGMAFCFGLGVAPLLEYNRQSSGTFQSIFGNLDQSYYGVDNRDLGHNLSERLRQAPVVIESGQLWEWGGLYPNPIARELWLACILACLVAACVEQSKRGVRLFLPSLVALMTAQSSFTNTALWYTHFALMLPFMLMLVALGLDALLSLARRGVSKPLAMGVVALLALLWMSYDVQSVAHYHQALARTGGLRTHSDAVYRLADYLGSYSFGQPVAALDWGIGPAVDMLTEGHSVPNEVFGYTWQADGGFTARLAPFLALDQSLYVLHVEGETVFPRRQEFWEAAQAAGRQPVLVTTIPDGQGRPFFEIWAAPPAP
jgi:hypothetical protein